MSEPITIWTWFDRLQALWVFLGVLFAIFAFFYWRWINRGGGWWIWEILFWPPEITKVFVKGSSGQPLPVVVTTRFTYVNSTLFPQILRNIVLKLKTAQDEQYYEFDPYEYMKADAFSEKENKWEPHPEERWRPYLVKARSEAILNIMFVSVGQKDFRDIEPGRYLGSLEFEVVKGKLFKKNLENAPSISFTFDLEKSMVEGFAQSNYAVGVLSRDMAIEVSKPRKNTDNV